MERGFDDATAILALPAAYRKRLRIINSQERLNEEIRRRERVIRIFPNRESAMRLLGALLMEQDEVWSIGRRYFEMTDYWTWRATQDAPRGVPLSPLKDMGLPKRQNTETLRRYPCGNVP